MPCGILFSHAEFAESRKDYAGHNLDKTDYAEHIYFGNDIAVDPT